MTMKISRNAAGDASAFFARHADKYAGWRRHLHQWPELAYEEHRTSQFIADQLTEMGIEFETGIAGTGLVATLEGREDGSAVGLRADMDALPIPEEGDVPHRSKVEGVSHVCGHDGHVTMLLAAADYLSASRDFAGTVRFIFQPAEEAQGGGRVMVEEGLFERFPVETIFGMHNWPGLPLGTIAAKAGPIMAAMDLFTITLRGAGVHAALPHLGTDSIVASGALISSLQTIASRAVDAMQPIVVSLTQIRGGNSLNAIPNEVVLNGTVRSLWPESRAKVRKRLEEIVTGIAGAHAVEAHFAFESRYPVTVNDRQWAAVATAIAVDICGREKVLFEHTPSMASEDFAFMLDAKPGCYVWIGNGCDVPLHSPLFDFNDELIPFGAHYWVELARNWARKRDEQN